MIKKIACPTDFSASANNAVEYASKLAQRLGAGLTLIHIQHLPVGEGVNLASGSDLSTSEEERLAANSLEVICNEINTSFQIPCDFEIIVSMGLFEKVVADELGRFDLTIIGTNGADNLFQFYFGSHSYRMMKNAANPVLIIPEGFTYSDIRHVVFASEYSGDDLPELQKLKQITDVYKPVLHVVNIKERENEESKALYDAFCKTIQQSLSYTENITFEGVVDDDEPDAIQKYMKKTKSDMMVLGVKKHGFFYNLFHTNIVKNLTTYTEYPLLVFSE